MPLGTENRSVFATHGGTRVGGRAVPVLRRAGFFLGREDFEYYFFCRLAAYDRSRAEIGGLGHGSGSFDRSRWSDRSNDRGGRCDGGFGWELGCGLGDRSDRFDGSGLFGRERIFVLALRGDDLNSGG